jgi:hypothetical protein
MTSEEFSRKQSASDETSDARIAQLDKAYGVGRFSRHDSGAEKKVDRF